MKYRRIILKLELYDGCSSSSIYVNGKDIEYINLKELKLILDGKINTNGLSKDDINCLLFNLIETKGKIISCEKYPICFDYTYLYKLEI